MSVSVRNRAQALTDELNALIRDAKQIEIDTIVLRNGNYKITSPLYLYTGLVLRGESKGDVVVQQLTWGYPAFDLLDTDSCSVMNITIVSNQARTYFNGFYSRGTDGFVNNAGIYSNSHFGTFNELSVSGFTCGIFLSSWNGIGLYEQKQNNRIENLRVDSVDFGLLITGQKSLVISEISGSYRQQSGSSVPPHLIYFSDAIDTNYVWTENCILKIIMHGIAVVDMLIRLGSVRNGLISNIATDNCT